MKHSKEFDAFTNLVDRVLGRLSTGEAYITKPAAWVGQAGYFLGHENLSGFTCILLPF
jgi:hypothetical protein